MSDRNLERKLKKGLVNGEKKHKVERRLGKRLQGFHLVNEDTLLGLTGGFLLLLAIAGIPISLTVITWKWFSAQENE